MIFETSSRFGRSHLMKWLGFSGKSLRMHDCWWAGKNKKNKKQKKKQFLFCETTPLLSLFSLEGLVVDCDSKWGKQKKK